jgi:hypothetical protein
MAVIFFLIRILKSVKAGLKQWIKIIIYRFKYIYYRIIYKDKDLAIIASSNLFNRNWYLKMNDDVKKAKVCPDYHYLIQGWKEGRNPSSLFNGHSYLSINPDVAQAGINPLLHYEKYGKLEARLIENRNYSFEPSAKNSFVPITKYVPLDPLPVKIIAFYQPKFYEISENNSRRGDGCSEWSNIKEAKPLFRDHYQPHVPSELGYYDLLDVNVMKRQVEIAQLYGIGGFCFYFYWFDGKILFEKPLLNYLNDKTLNLPFCLCWAYENFIRQLDGNKRDNLMDQGHSPKDDLAFIKYVSKYFHDNRYIRVSNKPLLIVNRPDLMPSAEKTTESWRNWCRVNGFGEIYLAYVQSAEKSLPHKYGYDAAIEFPPKYFGAPIIANDVEPISNGFNYTVYDWRAMVKMSEHSTSPDYKLYRGVCPSWDNTPEIKNESAIYIKNRPVDFQKWVFNVAKDTISRFENPDEKLVFVNAWNDWAVGAHLEPDRKYGYAYLRAISDALLKLRENRTNILSSPISNLEIENRNKRILLNIIDYNHIKKNINKKKRSILYDLFFSRSSFHGGGEYGKAVFKELSNKVSKSDDIELWVVADVDEFLDEWIWEICKQQHIKVIPVKSYKSIIDIVNLDLFDVFFAPAIVIYAEGYEYFVKPGNNINFTSKYTKVIGVLLDIRDYELAKDYSKIIYHRQQLKCHPEVKLSDDEIDQIINQKKYDSEQLKKMYIEICTCPSIDSIITISEYSKNSIISEIIDCSDKLHVFYAPMKHRASPTQFSIIDKHLDFESYALIINAIRIEKNAASAIIAWDEIFSDPALKSKISDQYRVIITGVNSIEDITTQKLANYERFICLPFLPPENLEYLYMNTILLIYISFSEGFGYPPIEVMSYNKPCLVSNVTSLPEICGNAVIYCDPYNIDSIKQGIIRAMDIEIPADIIEKQYNEITKKQNKDLGNLCDLIMKKSHKITNRKKDITWLRPNNKDSIK